MAAKKTKKPKKRKSRTAKKAATAALAVGIGAANVLGHEKAYIEIIQAQPDIAMHQDAAIIATATATAVTIPKIPPKQYE